MSQRYPFEHGQTYLITAKHIGAITANHSAHVSLQEHITSFSVWIAIQNSQNKEFSLLNSGLQAQKIEAFLERGGEYLDAKAQSASDTSVVVFDDPDPFGYYLFKITGAHNPVEAVLDDEWRLETVVFANTRFYIQPVVQKRKEYVISKCLSHTSIQHALTQILCSN